MVFSLTHKLPSSLLAGPKFVLKYDPGQRAQSLRSESSQSSGGLASEQKTTDHCDQWYYKGMSIEGQEHIGVPS